MRSAGSSDQGALAPSWPRTPLEWLRLVGNLANTTTVFGLVVAKVGRAHIRPGPGGLILAEGYRLPFPVAGAFTMGSVLTTPHTWPVMLERFPGLLRHEERHTWQYLYCVGLPFYPAYAVCMAYSMLRTGDRAARNFFERQAGLQIGGYRDAPVRPVTVNLAAIAGRIAQAGTKLSRR